ncbi:MAG: Calx-beta domain-containing protein [Chloroflexota bacterium]
MKKIISPNSTTVDCKIQSISDYIRVDTLADSAEETDFIGIAGQQVTFLAGTTSQIVDISIIGDSLVEADERFTVTLSSPLYNGVANSPQVGLRDETQLITILNDDLSVIGFSETSLTVNEQASTFDFEVEIVLDQPSFETISVTVSIVEGSASNGSDFAGVDQTLTIPVGETSAKVLIPISADDIEEENETFALTLSDPVNGTLDPIKSNVTVTIVDVATGETTLFMPLIRAD